MRRAAMALSAAVLLAWSFLGGAPAWALGVPPPPTVTGLSPTSGPTEGGTSVTVTGTGLSGAALVTFDGQPAFAVTVVSDTELTGFAPPHAAGRVDVQVTTPTGTSDVVPESRYTYVDAPTISALSPTSGPVAGGVSVTVSGSGFTGASDVRFGLTPGISPTVVSDTELVVTAPPHAAGVVDVTVTGLAGTTAPGPATQFTYVAPPPAPAVTAVAPTSGTTKGGTSVLVTGTNFAGATAVAFGAKPATSFTVLSATQLSVVAPPHAAGLVNLRVTTPSGRSPVTVKGRYTYVAPPAVTGISPSTGLTRGGTTVTITGTGFTGATAVSFGVKAATSFVVDSPTQIRAVSPPRAAGVVPVRVTTPFGRSAAVPADLFTYTVAAPGSPR